VARRVRVGGWRHGGGIVALADLLDAHKGAFEYEWRARFGKSLRCIGRSMPWGEALRLTQRLSQDPSSWICAALWDWEYPMTREALLLADVYDSYAAVHFKAPKPYPRPFRKTRKAKPAASLSQEQIIAALRGAGHTAPIPMRDEVDRG
jgi:hypothetical protein